MNGMKLGKRIVMLFLGLLLLIQTASYAVIQRAIDNSARSEITAQLEVGERIFKKTLAARGLRLAESAAILASDYGFKQAVMDGDKETLNSALQNNSNRLGAKIAFYTDPDFKVQNSINPDMDYLLPQMKDRYLKTVQRTGVASRLVTLNGRVYQLVVTPVKAPETMGWVVMGFPIENSDLAELKDISKLDAALLKRTQGEPWAVFASAMPVKAFTGLAGTLSAKGENAFDQGLIVIDGREYAGRWMEMSRDGDEQSAALLLRSVDEAKAPYNTLKWIFGGLTCIGVIIFGMGCVWTARRVTQPLANLALAAEGLAEGDFEVHLEQKGNDEVGELSRSFEKMRNSLKSRENDVLRLAYWDALTGLPNRERFRQELASEIDKGNPCSVLMLDLDRLKNVNDMLGQQFGDKLLQQTAERLESLKKPSQKYGKPFAARLGGDEFAVLLPMAGVDGGELLAKSIQNAFQEPLILDGQAIDLGAGMGLSVYPDHGDNPETLMSRAEMAMYAAKNKKMPLLHYLPSMDSGSQASLSLLSELRRAIEEGELRLYLQPKVSLMTGEVEGAEALVRWQHPERGLLPPSEFIPFAEQTGFIKNISFWMVKQSALTIARLEEAGLALKVSVNLSTRDFSDPDLSSYVAEQLRNAKVPANRLCLEITESALMDSPEKAMETLHILKEMGTHLSIDDFGTGYSSLAYLRRMPLNELKIDRSFVMGLEGPGAEDQIVRSTIELAHNLGLYVVAEGVETETAALTLRRLGCDQAQGYWVSKPMPEEAFLSWVLRWDAPTSLHAKSSEPVAQMVQLPGISLRDLKDMKPLMRKIDIGSPENRWSPLNQGSEEESVHENHEPTTESWLVKAEAIGGRDQ